MLSLTPQDYARALVTSKHFTALFGGYPGQERPRPVKGNILCLDMKKQPYAPTSPGKAGLVFLMPDTVVLEDNCEAFHIFMSMSESESTTQTGSFEAHFRYFGTYTKVPITRTILGGDEWCSLPTTVGGVLNKVLQHHLGGILTTHVVPQYLVKAHHQLWVT